MPNVGLGWFSSLRDKAPTSVKLQSERLLLTSFQKADAAAWVALRAQSANELRPFEPLWADDALSAIAFKRRLDQWHALQKAGTGLALAIRQRTNYGLLGAIQLHHIYYGALRASTLSYWCGTHFTNQGIISEAIPLVVAYAFGQLHLHRLGAYSQPSNVKSIRVLEKSGFVLEGLARRYLRINGDWQDHLRYVSINPND